jgi:hypothetical protein
MQLADAPGLRQFVHVVIETVHKLAHFGVATEALVMVWDAHGVKEEYRLPILPGGAH